MWKGVIEWPGVEAQADIMVNCDHYKFYDSLVGGKNLKGSTT